MTDPWAPFEAIDEHTPLRYRYWLAQASDLERALAVPGSPKAVEAAPEPDGRVAVTMDGTFHNAVFQLLRMRGAGIAVRGVETVGAIVDPPAEVAERVIEDSVGPTTDPRFTARLWRLAGWRALERCISATMAQPSESGPYAVAARIVAGNTPGTEGTLLQVASALADRPDWEPLRSGQWIEAARWRIQLSELSGLLVAINEAHLIRFVGHPLLGEAAADVAAVLPAPLSMPLAEALCRAVESRERRVAEPSVGALERAAPSSEVRATLELALRSDAASVRSPALTALAAIWGAGARASWREMLKDRSVFCRFTAEWVMAANGDDSDVPDVIAAVGRVLRVRGDTGFMPTPRGAVLVDFLVRHRDHPDAAPGIADIHARWGRMPRDLQDWIARHHPELAPGGNELAPPEAADPASSPEPPPLTGPDAPPFEIDELEDDGEATHTISIDETAAHEDEDRIERFVARLTAMPGITAFQEDRELIIVQAPGLVMAALVAAVDQAWAASAVPTTYSAVPDALRGSARM